MKRIGLKKLCCVVFALNLMTIGCAELNPKFEESLNSALDAKKDAFKKCYEDALKKDRNARGEMDIKLEFTPNKKKAEKAKITRSEIKNKQMKTCVTKAAKSISTSELPGTWVNGKYTIEFALTK